MQQKLIVGVDVSKKTLDLFFKPCDVFIQIQNAAGGFKEFAKQLKSLGAGDVLVVMEHTGLYSFEFEKFLTLKGISYCKVPALQIKRSLGVVRGKNDKIDSRRIAEFGWLRREVLHPDLPIEENIRQLRSLVSLRRKIVKDKAGYVCRRKEMLESKAHKASCLEIKIQKQIIQALKAQILELDNAIVALIRSSDELSKNYDLLQTIKGVGPVVATYMICCTGNFQRFTDPRKFNCYAGLAPFKYESGTSIRGKSRVSHLANKEAKALLDRAASTALQYDPELKKYYERRVAEGMRKRCCINIIRSKIVTRIFAVVKRQTPFVVLKFAA